MKYTWDDLYNRAIGCCFGSEELVAKDNARWQMECLILDQTGVDINDCEIPEEEIEAYLERLDEEIYFDEDGNIIVN